MAFGDLGDPREFTLVIDDFNRIFEDHLSGSVEQLKIVSKIIYLGSLYTSMGLEMMVEKEIFKDDSLGRERFLDEILTAKKLARDRSLTVVREVVEQRVNNVKSIVADEVSREQLLLDLKLKKKFEREGSALMGRLGKEARQEHLALIDELEEKANRARLALICMLGGE